MIHSIRDRFFLMISLYLVLVLSSCTMQPPVREASKHHEDPLPSWSDVPSKDAITAFVQATTDTADVDFIPVNERIAVFDNDGTLWCEQPAYFQFYFIMDRVRQLAPQHPEWANQEPYKSALAGDMAGVIKAGSGAMLTLTLVSISDLSVEEYDNVVREWIDTTRHPTSGRLLKEMVYQPMLEVLQYLRSNGFKTYIVSGGGLDFMRPWTEELYGIPPEQVLGSTVRTEFEIRDGVPEIIRIPELEFYNDRTNKPLAINKVIGRRPVAAFGNSDGDLAMLQWTAAGDGKRLMVYIHHTDSLREYAYDRNSPIGRLDAGLDVAAERGWSVVDMKQDWKVIFPKIN